MKKEIIKHPIRYAVIATACIYVIYLLIMIAIFKSSDESIHVVATNDMWSIESTEEPWIDIGTFGDMFGALNAFFATLAFFGVVYSTHIQRRSIEISSENELKNRQLQEKAWLFQQTDRVSEKWDSQRTTLGKTGNEIEKDIRKCIKNGFGDEDVLKLSKIVSCAKGALIAYNIILYSLRFSESINDGENNKDLAYMTYAELDEDLQFCLGVLFIDSKLVQETDFLQEIFNEDEFVRKFCKSNMMPEKEATMRELVQKIRKKVRGL